jgi:hypothetical protein
MVSPFALAVDGAGNVIIADSGANAVFKLSLASESLLPAIGYVLNSASVSPQPVAVGVIVTLYGAGIGPAELVAARLDQKGLPETTLGGAQVLSDGTPAPLVYVSTTQAAAVVPYGVSASTVVTVGYGGHVSPPLTLPVAWTAPALFTAYSSGAGQAVATNGNGSLNSASRPAAIGSCNHALRNRRGPNITSRCRRQTGWRFSALTSASRHAKYRRTAGAGALCWWISWFASRVDAD